MSFQDFVDTENPDQAHKISPKALIGIAAAVFIIVGVACFIFTSTGNAASETLVVKDNVQNSELSEHEEQVSSTAQQEICVHIGGSVIRPGICYLKEGARVADAVEAAGGMSEDAAVDAINLAKILTDGEQIIIASKEELAQQQQLLQQQASPSGNVNPSSSAQSGSGKININTASAAELQTINGIGQSKAEKIIAYREKSGPFKSISELTNVSGIGDKTLESIKDSICV